ncbi:MAG: enoyl-CoA hydratase-related protein [Alphaproteobacteria bacterium]|nr:enoyl-CoA hydratase-related protein [Alphaproteobacteria bacterium]
MSEPLVKVEAVGHGVMLIQLNRPEKRNALAMPVLQGLCDALDDAEANDTVRCVVLTGGDTVFAAGADINELARKTAVDTIDDARADAFGRVRNFSKPLVAAVNGYCLGGGLEIAMSCDIIVSGSGAELGLPEVNLGIMPGAGGTQWLPRLVGKSLAMKMILSGEFIGADEALRSGLVAEVVPDEQTISRATELAVRISRKAPLSLAIAKDAVLRAFEMPLAEGLAYERRAFAVLLSSSDKAEGTMAFLEKRKPVFQGK